MKTIPYIFIAILCILSGCETYPDATPLAPNVATGEYSNIYRKGATLAGTVTANASNESTIKECGILVSIMQSMAEPDTIKTEKTVNGVPFSIQIRNLEPGKQYYYQAYTSSKVSIEKGEVKTFITTVKNPPVFSELILKEKDHNKAILSTSFEDEGGSAISIQGFCWTLKSEKDTPELTDNSINIKREDLIGFHLSGLYPNREYATRAYAVNGEGIGYSNALVFKTDAKGEPIFNQEINPWGKPDNDIEEIIPPAILEEIEEYMPIYRGTNPPDVEGCYLFEPEAVYCQDGVYEPGFICTSEIIRLSNQNNKTLTLDFTGKSINNSSHSEGTGSFISGEGNNFTVYFDTEGENQGIYTKMASVYSGTISKDGIINLYNGFIMVDKGDDPEGVLMGKGVFRLFKDKDGLAVNTTWEYKETRSATFPPTATMSSNYWTKTKNN